MIEALGQKLDGSKSHSAADDQYSAVSDIKTVSQRAKEGEAVPHSIFGELTGSLTENPVKKFNGPLLHIGPGYAQGAAEKQARSFHQHLNKLAGQSCLRQFRRLYSDVPDPDRYLYIFDDFGYMVFSFRQDRHLLQHNPALPKRRHGGARA